MERVADYIINRLVENGIGRIFLVTGRGILYLTDAVAKNEKIQPVSTYHEQGASYATMAYASASDGMGACLISTGCAATNAVTAALCAYQDNLPVIFISGQHMLNETTEYTGIHIRTYGSQEADIISVVKPVTKYAVMLRDKADVAMEMDKCLYYANEGRKGPVWIDVPLDIQNARVEPESLKRWRHSEKTDVVSEKAVESVVEAINSAQRPILYIGGGVRSSDATKEIREFVEKTHIPLVFSPTAADVYGSSNDLSIGAVGSIGGSRAGNIAVQNSDLVLAIGTKLCSQAVGDFNDFARCAKIVVVDIDPEEHKKNGVKINTLIIDDAKDFLLRLLKCNIHMCNDAWDVQCRHWKETFDISNETFIKELSEQGKIDLYHFADRLSSNLSDDATVITDAGLEELTIPSTIKYRNGQRCLFPATQGAMGYAIPAILGAYYAGKDKIITVVGDGSIMMNIQELQVIGARQIPATIFVINNNMYAVIRKRQKDLFRQRTIGNDSSDGVAEPDFGKIADCFGLQYMKIAGERELDSGLQKAMSFDKPIICEVMCVEDQKYLHMSFAFNDKHRMERRPLEDLSPFIDREFFQKEMEIKLED